MFRRCATLMSALLMVASLGWMFWVLLGSLVLRSEKPIQFGLWNPKGQDSVLSGLPGAHMMEHRTTKSRTWSTVLMVYSWDESRVDVPPAWSRLVEAPGFLLAHTTSAGLEQYQVYFPTWLPPIVFGILPALSLHRWRRRRRRAHRGQCLRCGYDLAQNVTGVCPECGNKFGSAA